MNPKLLEKMQGHFKIQEILLYQIQINLSWWDKKVAQECK